MNQQFLNDHLLRRISDLERTQGALLKVVIGCVLAIAWLVSRLPR